MKKTIYLRPLELEDAKVSFQWRNNPEIWKYTRFNPSVPVTLEMETQWLAASFKCKDQIRFAICVEITQEYIGNVQLIKMTSTEGEFHLFIGKPNWWGKGVGREVVKAILNFAFIELNLKRVLLEVHRDNFPALAIYKKYGFVDIDIDNPYNLMELTKSKYLDKLNFTDYEKNNYFIAKKGMD